MDHDNDYFTGTKRKKTFEFELSLDNSCQNYAGKCESGVFIQKIDD
jgi:hypothetical protein